MQEISKWLLSRDYAEGVKLYSRYGTNDFLKNRFAAGDGEYNRSKLFEELKSLYDQAGITSVLVPPLLQSAVTNPTPETKAGAAKRYLDATKKRDLLYRELNVYMEQKFHLPPGDLLRDCCRKILSTNQRIQDLYILTDYYTEHGCFADEQQGQPQPDTYDALHVKISRAKKRLASGSCRNIEKTQALIDDLQRRLAYLNKTVVS